MGTRKCCSIISVSIGKAVTFDDEYDLSMFSGWHRLAGIYIMRYRPETLMCRDSAFYITRRAEIPIKCQAAAISEITTDRLLASHVQPPILFSAVHPISPRADNSKS